MGDVVIDAERFLLERDGHDVRVEPQVFDVLVCLIAHRDRVVLKSELLDEVWGDVARGGQEELESLTKCTRNPRTASTAGEARNEIRARLCARRRVVCGGGP